MKRLLIANRGEIALRILRACRVAGIESVAAYTQVDKKLPHIPQADDAVCVGHHSYLDVDQMVSAAITRGCDAVHPGYGFLAENVDFARKSEVEGLTFVGPSHEHIERMADKAMARTILADKGVPVLPGTDALTSAGQAANAAREIGYPLMLKASFGGGGRGMSVVNDDEELTQAYEKISDEAASLFADRNLYAEKYLDGARHIEIQIAGDGLGEVIHFGARECSIQRRHQKLVEEAPPQNIDAAELERLAGLCCRALSEIKYRSLGTLEFLYKNGDFYFIEMNTRVQVEHPVTEAVTGIDLVRLQIETAASGQLPIKQNEIAAAGHAIECRINAENKDFQPAPGLVNRLRVPGGPGIRFDSHLYEGYEVSHYYDSLVGKLISYGQDRNEAIARMNAAILELDTGLLENNAGLHMAILSHEKFLRGTYDTGFLAEIGRLT